MTFLDAIRNLTPGTDTNNDSTATATAVAGTNDIALEKPIEDAFALAAGSPDQYAGTDDTAKANNAFLEWGVIGKPVQVKKDGAADEFYVIDSTTSTVGSFKWKKVEGELPPITDPNVPAALLNDHPVLNNTLNANAAPALTVPAFPSRLQSNDGKLSIVTKDKKNADMPALTSGENTDILNYAAATGAVGMTDDPYGQRLYQADVIACGSANAAVTKIEADLKDEKVRARYASPEAYAAFRLGLKEGDGKADAEREKIRKRMGEFLATFPDKKDRWKAAVADMSDADFKKFIAPTDPHEGVIPSPQDLPDTTIAVYGKSDQSRTAFIAPRERIMGPKVEIYKQRAAALRNHDLAWKREQRAGTLTTANMRQYEETRTVLINQLNEAQTDLDTTQQSLDAAAQQGVSQYAEVTRTLGGTTGAYHPTAEALTSFHIEDADVSAYGDQKGLLKDMANAAIDKAALADKQRVKEEQKLLLGDPLKLEETINGSGGTKFRLPEALREKALKDREKQKDGAVRDKLGGYYFDPTKLPNADKYKGEEGSIADILNRRMMAKLNGRDIHDRDVQNEMANEYAKYSRALAEGKDALNDATKLDRPWEWSDLNPLNWPDWDVFQDGEYTGSEEGFFFKYFGDPVKALTSVRDLLSGIGIAVEGVAKTFENVRNIKNVITGEDPKADRAMAEKLLGDPNKAEPAKQPNQFEGALGKILEESANPKKLSDQWQYIANFDDDDGEGPNKPRRGGRRTVTNPNEPFDIGAYTRGRNGGSVSV